MALGVFTGTVTVLFEVKTMDQFGVNGRNVVYLPESLMVNAADRYQAQTWTLSAGLSAEALNLAPLGVSVPVRLFQLHADQPVDLRFSNPAGAVALSGVKHLTTCAEITALYVTTGEHVTTLHMELIGGSNTTVTTSFPVP